MTISYPRDWPGTIGLTKSRFGISVNQSIFSSDLSRDSVVQSHAAGKTDRWEGLVTTVPLYGATLAEMRALITSLRGSEKSFYLGDPDMKFARSGVVPGGGFSNWARRSSDLSAAAWVSLGTPTIVADVDGTADSLEDNNASAFEGKNQAISIPDDDAIYTVSIRLKKAGATIVPGINASLTGGTTVTVNARMDANSGTSTSESVVTDETTYWRWSFPIKNNKTGNRTLAVAIYPATRAAIGGADDATQVGTATFKDFQLERASGVGAHEATTTGPQVNGASQSGRTLITDGWLASSDVLFAGDYFGVGGELKIVTEKATTNGSGQVTISFEPALRASPADGAGITVVEPRATVRLESSDQFWEIDEMGLGQFSLAFEEVI